MLFLAGIGVFYLVEDIFRHFKPKQKPKKWKVNFHAPDGYPMRDYSLTENQMAKIMAMIHHELDHPSEGKTN